MNGNFKTFPTITPSAFTDLRRRCGSQRTVAAALGISPRTMWEAENSPTYPRRHLLAWALWGLLHHDTQAPTPDVNA